MQEEKYYQEIESYIKRNETNKKVRILEENYDTLNNYKNIGKLLVEAQGGKEKARYDDELIKKWSIKLSKDYGKGYNSTNLKNFRLFYLLYSKSPTLSDQLTWSHIVELLPIKEKNKRNYYINEVINNSLSVRKLREEIKSNAYERLLDKPEHIEMITSKEKYTITSNMKNPIIIKVDENKKIVNEKDLETTILAQLTFILTQFGKGYTFMANQFKIDKYYIDLLLFNIELNCYVIVELKLRKLKAEDKAQAEKYMKLVDENLKKSYHNKTLGIIISKEQDSFVANFVRSEVLVPLTYRLT